MFSGDPMTPKNKEYLEKSQLQEFRLGAIGGYGPEVDEEEIVRAMMVVRANAMTLNAPSPQLSQMLIDLLNRRITPVVQSRGTLGEGDLAQLSNVGATMVGAGDAYYQGTRMPAAEALAKAGLQADPAVCRRRQRTDQQRCLRHRYCGSRGQRCRARAGVGRSHLRHGSERNEFQHHAAHHPGAAGAAVQVAELGRGTRARHDQGQLSVQRRSAPDHSGSGEPAGFLHPPGVGLGGLGRSARRRGAADELIGSQSRGAHRSVAAGLVGPVHPADDEVLRQGRQEQQRQARLHRVECELGPLSDGEQARGLHPRAREHGHRGVAAHRSVLQSVLHRRPIRRRCCIFRRATVSQSIWPAAAASRRWI